MLLQSSKWSPIGTFDREVCYTLSITQGASNLPAFKIWSLIRIQIMASTGLDSVCKLKPACTIIQNLFRPFTLKADSFTAPWAMMVYSTSIESQINIYVEVCKLWEQKHFYGMIFPLKAPPFPNYLFTWGTIFIFSKLWVNTLIP